MESYTKFGYDAPIRFRVIGKNHTGGGGQNDPLPPGRRLKLRAEMTVGFTSGFEILTRTLIKLCGLKSQCRTLKL